MCVCNGRNILDLTKLGGHSGVGYLQRQGRVSLPSSFAIFKQHLAAFESLASTSSRFVTVELRYLLAAFAGLSSTSSRFVTASSFATFQQHLKVLQLRGRVSSPSRCIQQHLKVLHLRVRFSPSSRSILHVSDCFCIQKHSTVLNKFGLLDTN